MRTSKSSRGALVFLVGVAVGCGAAQDPAQEDLTAEEHEAEADREEREAGGHAAQYDPDARETSGEQGLGPLTVYGTEVYNPTAHHLDEAAEHQDHAEAHRRRAAELRGYSAHECARFPELVRASCPLLLNLEQVEDIEGGVRMVFSDDIGVEPVVNHIRCHIAFAAAHGTEGMDSCALYVHGASVEVQDNIVELTTTESDHVADLRRRVREQAP